jgi:hypothetical protein
MDRDAVRPPLRQEVQLSANGETLAQLGDRTVDQSALAAVKREQEHRHGTEEGIG